MLQPDGVRRIMGYPNREARRDGIVQVVMMVLSAVLI